MHEPPSIYGIIGNPLAHSLSPLMHNAAFKALDVNAVYKLFPLEDLEELKLFMEDLKEENNPIYGLNVTVPYKEAIMPYVDTVDPFAKKVGAVNTLAITNERKIIGLNTDGPGFLSHLQELKFDPEGKRIAILGAGGTTRAILTVLCMIHPRPESIKLYNRTPEKAVKLVEELGTRMDASLIEVVNNTEDLNIEIADILINSTSIGLKGEKAILIDPQSIHADILVYDVIYNPQETELLKVAKSRGARISNGLGMLYYQGVLAFTHWAGMDIDEKYKKIMRKALEEGLGKQING